MMAAACSDEALLILREPVVAEACSWVGTPYRHQASVKGVGCDCLGLIRGVWRACIGPEPETMPAYARDWGVATGKETLIAAAERYLVRVMPVSAVRPGDILVFRIRHERVAQHAGILVDRDRMVHAQEKVGVVEANLGLWWWRRVAAVYAFPAICPA